MEMVLQRERPIGDAIHGTLTVSNVAVARSLERHGVEIPAGRYRVVLYDSPRFQKLVPLLLDVPGRTAIEIHGANEPKDLNGCIGAGQERTPTGIRNCTPVLNMVVRLITLAAQRKDATFITVVNPAADGARA